MGASRLAVWRRAGHAAGARGGGTRHFVEHPVVVGDHVVDLQRHLLELRDLRSGKGAPDGKERKMKRAARARQRLAALPFEPRAGVRSGARGA